MPGVSSELRAYIDVDTGAPRVLLAIIDDSSGSTILPVTYSPEEARETASAFLNAAESIEQDAHLIATMRSLKYAEHHIAEVIEGVRARRGLDLDSVTLPESHEEGDTG